jgi:tetratricopeptide (TPR) repeat protein
MKKSFLSIRHVIAGRMYLEKCNYKLALSEFDSALKINPNDAIAYMLLGWVTYGYKKDFKLAKKYLSIAINLDDSLADAHMYLGIVLNRLGNKRKSEYHFKKSIKLSHWPDIPAATYAEEYLWHNSKYGEAERYFNIALHINPNSVLALRDYARMLSHHGRNDEAIELIEKAIEIDPNDRFSKREYKIILKKKGNNIFRLRQAVKKDPKYFKGIMKLNKMLKDKKGL